MNQPKEFKIISLRECPTPDSMQMGDSPDKIASYYRANVVNGPSFNSCVENLIVVTLNARRRIMGHCYISTGTLDTILVHPREVFRPAILSNASALVLMHNHPSGDNTPSEADIKVTRDLVRAGQLLKIEVLDHVIMGAKNEIKDYCSLRELGYFTT